MVNWISSLFKGLRLIVSTTVYFVLLLSCLILRRSSQATSIDMALQKAGELNIQQLHSTKLIFKCLTDDFWIGF